MATYLGLVLGRARLETRASLSLSAGLVMRTVLVSGVGVLFGWLFGTWDNAVNTAAAVFVGIILANIVVICGVLVIQIVRAPGLIHADQQTHIVSLSKKLGTFERTQQHRNTVRLMISRGKFLEEECLAKADPQVLQSEIHAWEERALAFAIDELHDEGVGHLFHAANESDYTPNPQEMRDRDMKADEYMRWLRLLRAKRRVLEDLSAEITPQLR